MCRFSDAGNDDLTICSGGRRPLAFRLIMQPIVAALLAIRAGLRDAQVARPAYGWAFLAHSGDRLERLRAGWNDVARLFAAAIIIDLIYEIYVFRWIYPGQALIVAAILASAKLVLPATPPDSRMLTPRWEERGSSWLRR
jgi:hypothetical protein